MKVIMAAMTIAILFGLQGWATVTKATKDTVQVQVQVSNCSAPMDCTATNKKGSWSFAAKRTFSKHIFQPDEPPLTANTEHSL